MIRTEMELGPQTKALFERLVIAIETHGATMALDFTSLTDKVTKIDNAVAAAVTAFQAIAAELANAAGDQARVAELAADLDQHADALAAAIPANTPTPTP